MYDDMVSPPLETNGAVISAMDAANDEAAAPSDNGPANAAGDERARIQALADRLARGVTGRNRTLTRPDGWRLANSPDEPEGVFEGPADQR